MGADSHRPEPVLRAEGVVKRYPGTTALDGVDFNVYPGKVNVLIGENGAGKSTLMRILAGAERPSEGRLLLRGEEIELGSTRDGLAHGIGIIYQELNLFPDLSVGENIFIGREIVSDIGTVRHREQDEKARSVMARLEQPVDPRTLVRDLRIGQQQLVEVARALSEDVSMLIMDEPTSALSDHEADVLLRIIEELTVQGVAVVYISHKLDECLRIGDYFTVLRDGRLVAETSSATLDWIVESMSGRRAGTLFQRVERDVGSPVLQVESMTLPRPSGDGFRLNDISFSVRAGEIVGIYGLMGAGRTELLECIFGMQSAARGRILLDGREIQALYINRRIKAGLALVPEDRQLLGLLQNLSVAENVTIASLGKINTPLGLSTSKQRELVRRLVDKLSIKLSDPGQLISTLSGGNQQKVIIARSLLTAPRVLMLDEPTRGVDVGTKSDIFEIMKELAGRGVAVLFVSSELKEVVSMADRALVMARGRLTGEFAADAITEQNLAKASVLTAGQDA